ncbi:hypothetical protein ACLIBH_11665 [Virgibacillus sp. W0430]|uniref:hypothetical protein n=1 Tax=Virgibacillus sp. W0430 TaxID=3391580 RepID=UPI003F475334
MAITYKKCFTCGSLDVAKIVYGSPTVEAFKEQEEGKIKLGGCMISEESPQYHCNECETEWTVDEAIDAAYNEIVGLRASVGGFFGGYYDVTIHFQAKLLVWKYSLESEPIEKELSEASIKHFIDRLKRLELLNWKSRYEDPNVLDGTQWKVEIIREKRNLRRSGSNKFPDEWKSFCALIQEITGLTFE